MDLVKNVVAWFEVYSQDITSAYPDFDDPALISMSPQQCTYLVKQMLPSIQRLSKILERANPVKQTIRPRVKTTYASRTNEALIAALENSWHVDGPGEMREGGMRHDNDFTSIQDIEIAPTHEELVGFSKHSASLCLMKFLLFSDMLNRTVSAGESVQRAASLTEDKYGKAPGYTVSSSPRGAYVSPPFRGYVSVLRRLQSSPSPGSSTCP